MAENVAHITCQSHVYDIEPTDNTHKSRASFEAINEKNSVKT